MYLWFQESVDCFNCFNGYGKWGEFVMSLILRLG